MKQKIKRIWLVLCMITCFFALSACQRSDVSDEMEVDAQTSESISAFTTSLLEQMTSMTDEKIKEQMVLAERNKDFVFSEGFQSWLNVKNDVGDYLAVLSSEVTAEDNGYSCMVRADFSNRELEYKIFLDDEGNVTSISFTPEYTVKEKMTKAVMNTLMGMGTVFIVLIFIIFLISLFKYINIFEQKFRRREEPAAIISEPIPAEHPQPAAPLAVSDAAAEAVSEDITENLELIAVITAAIAAAEGTAAKGLVVRSIRRASAAKWKKA